jgi:hypothetical protein
LFYRKAVVVRERTLTIGARIVSVPGTVGDVIGKHVVLETESIDRMYLNVYQPGLQHGGGAASFFRFHRGEAFATARTMSRMTHKFVGDIFRFADHNEIPVVPFEKGVRKDDIALARYADFEAEEGVVFIGKAQEKATVHRTVTRRHPQSGRTYPWLTRSTAMVNHYYFYCIDKDFGPFFIKFCSYFPYTARLCINGHEYLKRKLAQQGIHFEALDNGILSCDEPKRLQSLCDGLSPAKIDRFLRKWLKRLPHPFTTKDRKAGYLYDVSILQAEFALTQVLDRPVSGRVFFEEVIRQNLDVGRPDKVQLVFNRRVHRNTPGRFRTRVITQGVTPSLHIDYKSTRIKQYHKFWRPRPAGSVSVAVDLSSTPKGFLQSRSAHTIRAPVGPTARPSYPGTNDVSTAAASSAWLHPSDSQDAPIRGYRLRYANRPVLRGQCVGHPPTARRCHLTPIANRSQNTPQNPPQTRQTPGPIPRTTTSLVKLDSTATTSVN